MTTVSRGELVTPDGATIRYACVGEGEIAHVHLPGVEDALVDLDTRALALPTMYPTRKRGYRTCVISRRDPIPVGFSVEETAADVEWALDQLAWGPVVLEGLSGGGPLAQQVAADRPDLVSALVLVSTFHRPDRRCVEIGWRWARLARSRRWAALNWSVYEHTFLPQTLKRAWFLLPFGLVTRARDPERMLNLLEALAEADTTEVLGRIECPTLVIGGEQDRIVSAATQIEMARLIPGSQCLLYSEYGHGCPWEVPGFDRDVDRFVREAIGLPASEEWVRSSVA